jgi:hypothetical protein
MVRIYPEIKNLIQVGNKLKTVLSQKLKTKQRFGQYLMSWL